MREATAGPPLEMIRTHASVKSLENSGLSSAHLALRGWWRGSRDAALPEDLGWEEDVGEGGIGGGGGGGCLRVCTWKCVGNYYSEFYLLLFFCK